MTQDITIIPFFISFDVIGNCIDIQTIFDFVKTNYKKEVIILNANDYLESSRHSSKSSSNSRKSKQSSSSTPGQNSSSVPKESNENAHKSGRTSRSSPHSAHDGSRSIVKGFKAKIESDLPKLIDNKRKFIQQQEKKRLAKESQKAKEKSSESPARKKSSTPKSKTDKDEKPKFDGKIDVIYIIHNFPYLPSQLQAMHNGGIPIDAFIAFKNEDFNGNDNQMAFKSERSTDSKRNASKKGVVPGSSLDYINHPFSSPPVRWQMLAPTAPLSVSFAELNVEPDVESTFNNLIDLLLRIQRQQTDVTDFLSERKFVEIPSNPKPLFTPDYSVLKNYLLHSDNQKHINSPFKLVDAILSQLKAGKWDLMPIPSLPTIAETYQKVFQKTIEESDKRIIANPSSDDKSETDSFYESNNSSSILPSVYEYFYNFLHWAPNKENMYQCIAWCTFLKSEENLHCYAGQKFDHMYSRINKLYRFGLPMNFYDWQEWKLSVEHHNIFNYLDQCLKENSFVDSYFDEITGLQFLLILKPIARNIGSFVPTKYMPLSLTTNTDIKINLLKSSIDTIIDGNGTIRASNTIEKPKKSRKLITPSMVTNLMTTESEVKGETFYQLLPTLNSRFEAKDDIIYRMPIELTNSEGFTTPYFFEKSKLDVHICRNCINGKFSFETKSFIENKIKITSSSNAVSVFPSENIRFLLGFPFSITIVFDNTILCFDSEGIGLQITNQYPISITNQGNIVFMKEPGNPFIVTHDGTIGRTVDQTKWEYVDSNGETFAKRKNKKGRLTYKKIDRPHSSYYDGSTRLKTMIRPDGINYIINENNARIINFINNDLKIIQDSKQIEYQFVHFPTILYTIEDQSFTFNIDNFNFRFINDFAKIATDEFSILYENPSISFVCHRNDCEFYFTETSAEFKSGTNEILYANADGIERNGELISPDEILPKKIELIDTHWGKQKPIKDSYPEAQQIELHQMFSPKFFVIRSDFSATEFLRQDVLHLSDYKEYSKTFINQDGSEIKYKTYHKENQNPLLFVNNKALSKIDRVNLLKTVQIPQPPKKRQQAKKQQQEPSNEDLEDQHIMEQAKEAHHQMNVYFSSLQKSLHHILEIQQANYIDEITPIPPPPPQKVYVPPSTPTPRILQMQHNFHDVEGENNYWNSTDSEFGYPLKEQRKEERALSPRIQLCDPPRLFKQESNNIVKNQVEMRTVQLFSPNVSEMREFDQKFGVKSDANPDFVTQKMATVFLQEDKTKHNEIIINKTKINFGNVIAGKKYSKEVLIKNAGLKSLKYIFSPIKQNSENILMIVPISGSLTPGLTLKVRIELTANKPELLTSSTEFRCALLSSPIDIVANILEDPDAKPIKKRRKHADTDEYYSEEEDEIRE